VEEAVLVVVALVAGAEAVVVLADLVEAVSAAAAQVAVGKSSRVFFRFDACFGFVLSLV
jgi:hypothetical protein